MPGHGGDPDTTGDRKMVMVMVSHFEASCDPRLCEAREDNLLSLARLGQHKAPEVQSWRAFGDELVQSLP